MKITEKILSSRYLFDEDRIPDGFTETQALARKVFLEEIHKKNRYVHREGCPFCGGTKATRVSQVKRWALPADIVICDRCDGCFQRSVLDREAARRYYEEISPALGGKGVSDDEMRQLSSKRAGLFGYSRYDLISHFIKLDPEKDLIMELGCGDGSNLVPWKDHGYHTVGMDLDRRAVESPRGRELGLVYGDSFGPMISKFGRAGLVILSHALGYVDDVDALLKLLYEVIRPNGYIFIETPSVRYWNLYDLLVEYNYYFDLGSLDGIMERNGFKKIYANEYIHAIYTPRDNNAPAANPSMPFSLPAVKASLANKLIDIVHLRNERLHDVLNKRETGDIKVRIADRLQRIYCHNLCRALKERRENGNRADRVEKVARRFSNEKLAAHNMVDETGESFERLMHRVEAETNEKAHFEEAIVLAGMDGPDLPDKAVVFDIGAGVCWASCLAARYPKVDMVYAVDPSENRLHHGRFVIRHFGLEDKVRVVRGTFLEPNVPGKADLIILCGSFHHCYDKDVDRVFSTMRELLKPGGKILIANEQYVDAIFFLKRMLSYIKHFFGRKELYYYPLRNARKPDPFSGDHWRTRSEIEDIFARNDFKSSIFIQKGNLLQRGEVPFRSYPFGWHFYCAVLTPKG